MSGTPPERRRISVTAVAALIALATGATSLLFTLYPDLAPVARTRLAATIKSVAIDPNVTRAQFFAAYEPDAERRRMLEDAFLEDLVNAADPTPAQIAEARAAGALRAQRGSIVYVDTQGEGLKNKNISVSWYVYRADTRKREYGGEFADAELQAPDDHFVLPTFVDEPVPCDLLVFVRLELRDEDRRLLAIGTTRPFRSCPRRGRGNAT